MVDAGFSLRRGEPEDAPALWALRVDAIRRTCRGHYPDVLLDGWAAGPLPPSFASDIGRKHVVVATTGPRIAGFAILDAVTAEIAAVFVSPDHGRRGLGRQLLAQMEATAAGMGIRRLGVDASLNAVPFYAAAGYFALSQGIHTTSGGLEIACVRMAKTLA